MSETIAEQPEPIITPTSSSAVELSSRAVEAGPARRRPSRANNRTAARNAPAAAPPAMRHSESEPPALPASSSVPSAPTDAPPATPSTYGSASALRVSSCISAPESASAAPAPKPASTRGTRICQKISGDAAPMPVEPASTPRPQAPAASSAVRARAWRVCMGRGYKPWPSKRTPIQAWRPRPW